MVGLQGQVVPELEREVGFRLRVEPRFQLADDLLLRLHGLLFRGDVEIGEVSLEMARTDLLVDVGELFEQRVEVVDACCRVPVHIYVLVRECDRFESSHHEPDHLLDLREDGFDELEVVLDVDLQRRVQREFDGLQESDEAGLHLLPLELIGSDEVFEWRPVRRVWVVLLHVFRILVELADLGPQVDVEEVLKFDLLEVFCKVGLERLALESQREVGKAVHFVVELEPLAVEVGEPGFETSDAVFEAADLLPVLLLLVVVRRLQFLQVFH